MTTTPKCIKCGRGVTYFDGTLFHCTECFHEWTPADGEAAEQSDKVTDSNGNELFDGDDVTVIKDLKVKGSSMVAKRGARVRGIRLSADDPTHVQGRVDGQTIFILTEFLKK
jgi:protein PhnA